MAKKSWIERNQRKERTVVKYAERRKELKEAGDYAGLALLPRNASPVRVVNRCHVTAECQRLGRQHRLAQSLRKP